MASIAIDVPSSAEEGEVVPVSVRVTSTVDYHATFKTEIYAVPDFYPQYIIGSIEQSIMGGSSATYPVSFIMPDCNITVFVWVERWAWDHWDFAGSASKVVTFVPTEPPPVVPCEISIDAPASAQEGELVYMAAAIRNISAYDYSYKIEIYAGAELIYSTVATITGGSALSYAVPFTMPGRAVTLFVWVERWSVDHWAYDNLASREVALYEPPPPTPEFAGFSISEYTK